MIIGENKNKVKNIVTAQVNSQIFQKVPYPLVFIQMDSLELLFRDSWERLRPGFLMKTQAGTWQRDTDPKFISEVLMELPENLKRNIALLLEQQYKTERPQPEGNNGWGFRKLGEESLTVQHNIVGQSLSNIVRRSSIRQSMVGLLSAGPVKSALYSGAKLQKMISSF